jgi:hypothetical protein
MAQDLWDTLYIKIYINHILHGQCQSKFIQVQKTKTNFRTALKNQV